MKIYVSNDGNIPGPENYLIRDQMKFDEVAPRQDGGVTVTARGGKGFRFRFDLEPEEALALAAKLRPPYELSPTGALQHAIDDGWVKRLTDQVAEAARMADTAEAKDIVQAFRDAYPATARFGGVILAQCQAVQHSDSMVCEPCNLTWDAGDPEPPACNPKPVAPRAIQHLDHWCNKCGFSGTVIYGARGQQRPHLRRDGSECNYLARVVKPVSDAEKDALAQAWGYKDGAELEAAIARLKAEDGAATDSAAADLARAVALGCLTADPEMASDVAEFQDDDGEEHMQRLCDEHERAELSSAIAASEAGVYGKGV